MNKQNLLQLAEATQALVTEATSPQELGLVAGLALKVKNVLDNSNIHPDLGLELLEFAQLKESQAKGEVEADPGVDPVKDAQDTVTNILNSLKS
jgi:hypothetical protein